MARPKLSPEDLLSERVVTYVTRSDYQRAADLADKAGMSLTEYARVQLTCGKVVIKETRQLDHVAYDQIRRMGVNLNQLSRIANRDQQLPEPVSRLCTLIEKFMMKHITNDYESETGE